MFVIFRIPRYLPCPCRDILYAQQKCKIFILQKTYYNCQCFIWKLYTKFVIGLDNQIDGFLSRHENQSDRSVQKLPNFMLLMLCLILFWHSIVFYITHIFLPGKRSGRSKKWREMLKLPPVSQCEGIRCSIGRCPVCLIFFEKEEEEFGAVNWKDSVLLLKAIRLVMWWRIYEKINLWEAKCCITSCLLKETASKG